MNEHNDKSQQEKFYNVLKETYEKGVKDNKMTVDKLMDELIIKLQKLSS